MNITGIKAGQLRFTGPLLADIFLGKVTNWNDPRIAALNRGIRLPDASIKVVHRSDGSGTTFNWVNYLSKVSPEWRAKVGEGKSVEWPVGAGGNGNEGVSGLVANTENSIGYVELVYANRDRLSWAAVQNRAGRFVSPSAASFQAAAEGVKWDPRQDFYLVLTDAPGTDAYPITATTFILVPKHLKDFSRTRALIQLFEWALFKGQAEASRLGYVPLPPSLAARIAGYWASEIQH